MPNYRWVTAYLASDGYLYDADTGEILRKPTGIEEQDIEDSRVGEISIQVGPICNRCHTERKPKDMRGAICTECAAELLDTAA